MSSDPFQLFRRMVPWMPQDTAQTIFQTYMSSYAPDVASLADLYDIIGYPDPYLAQWLARWGPAVMDDQTTLTAIRDAYDHDYAEHGDSDYVPSFPQLPSKAKWTADELSPGTSQWKVSLLSPTRNWAAYSAQQQGQGTRTATGTRATTGTAQTASGEVVPVTPSWPVVHGNASEAKQTLEKIYKAVGGVTRDQLDKESFMASRFGFDGFWNEIWIEHDEGFSPILKDLYLHPQEKYDGLDFYQWVNRLIDENKLDLFPLLHLYYLIAITL